MVEYACKLLQLVTPLSFEVNTHLLKILTSSAIREPFNFAYLRVS